AISPFSLHDALPISWANLPGSYAEYAALPADRLVPVPARLAAEAAAAAIPQGMTAHFLAHDTYPVHEGDGVVVHAAAGRVGVLRSEEHTAELPSPYD